jgi:hypothetical protein
MTNNNGNIGDNADSFSAEGLSRYEMCKMADEILREAGLDIFGRPNIREAYLQTQFEDRITRCPFRGASR